jgi:hypothetical protein
MTGRIEQISLDHGATAARDRLGRSELGAVELARPPLDMLPYRTLVGALLARPGFRLDFNRMVPGAALDLLCDRLLGRGVFVAERALLAQDIAALAAFASRLVGARASVSLRSCFMPGDTVWHVDRVNEAAAFRLLWPLGRRAGMRITARANIDMQIFRMFHRREHSLLGALDTRVLRSPAPVETLWAHRPAQLEAMKTGRFPFLRDPALEFEVTPGAASIHCVETPAQQGAVHRSSWANRHAPGLQLVITAAAETP